MKELVRVSLWVTVVVLLSIPQVWAGSNNNGFPSGPHYNLNLIGKKSTFNQDGLGCVVDPLNYGNVVFVPEYTPEGTPEGDIWLKSGRKVVVPTLQVTDPCVTLFDGSPAVLQLPANPLGYRVYARALAKPTYDPENPDKPGMNITPKLIAVSSETETLIYLGMATSDGFVSAYAGKEISPRKKGKSTAIEISDIFDWSGYVCYDDPAKIPADSLDYPLTNMCGKDTSVPLDDIVDEIAVPNTDGTCPAGYPILVSLYCHHYDIPLWVFNIADFVTVLWSIENNGNKLVQIRFYPQSPQ